MDGKKHGAKERKFQSKNLDHQIPIAFLNNMRWPILHHIRRYLGNQKKP